MINHTNIAYTLKHNALVRSTILLKLTKTKKTKLDLHEL